MKTAKLGSLVDIQDSEDPEGLRVFYYLVQDLKVRRMPSLRSSQLTVSSSASFSLSSPSTSRSSPSNGASLLVALPC